MWSGKTESRRVCAMPSVARPSVWAAGQQNTRYPKPLSKPKTNRPYVAPKAPKQRPSGYDSNWRASLLAQVQEWEAEADRLESLGHDGSDSLGDDLDGEARSLTQIEIDLGMLLISMEKKKVKLDAVLREWDRLRDGSVSKGAFRVGLQKLGLEAPSDEVSDQLFDKFDPERSGTVELSALKHGFRRLRGVTQARYCADERRDEAAARAAELRARVATAKEAFAIATKADACDEELAALRRDYARSVVMQLGKLLLDKGEKGVRMGELVRLWPKPKSRTAEQLAQRKECAHEVSRDEFREQLLLLGLRVGAEPSAAVASARPVTGRADGRSPRTARKRKQQQQQQALVYRPPSRQELHHLFDEIQAENPGWLKLKELKPALMGYALKSRESLVEQHAKEREARATRLRAATLMQAALRSVPDGGGGHAAGTVSA